MGFIDFFASSKDGSRRGELNFGGHRFHAGDSLPDRRIAQGPGGVDVRLRPDGAVHLERNHGGVRSSLSDPSNGPQFHI